MKKTSDKLTVFLTDGVKPTQGEARVGDRRYLFERDADYSGEVKLRLYELTDLEWFLIEEIPQDELAFAELYRLHERMLRRTPVADPDVNAAVERMLEDDEG